MANHETSLSQTSAEYYLRVNSIVEDLRFEGHSLKDAKRMAREIINRPQNEPLSVPREGKHTKVKI